MPMHYQPAACFQFRLHCHHFNHVLSNPRKVLHGTSNRNGPLERGKMAPRPRPGLPTLEKEGVSHMSGSLRPCPGSLHPSAVYILGRRVLSIGLCDSQHSLEYIFTSDRTRSWFGNARLPGASVRTALAFSSLQPRVGSTFRNTTFYNL